MYPRNALKARTLSSTTNFKLQNETLLTLAGRVVNWLETPNTNTPFPISQAGKDVNSTSTKSGANYCIALDREGIQTFVSMYIVKR